MYNHNAQNVNNAKQKNLIVFIKRFERKTVLQGFTQGDYMTAREYANLLLSSLNEKNYSVYEHRVLYPEWLIIDQVEYLEHKTTTQEFLHQALQKRVADKKRTVIISEIDMDRLQGMICKDFVDYLTTENI
jgi:DNA replication protein DnaC